MPRQYFCAKCHRSLTITRKALKEYACIVDLVLPHDCSEEPIPFDFKPTIVPKFETGLKDKIDQNIINLQRNIEPGDRRNPKDIKSTAPMNVLDQLKSMSNQLLEKESDEPEE